MRRCRSVRSIRTANQSWRSRKSCAGTARFTVCALSRSAISTRRALQKISAKITAVETHLIPNVLKVALGQKPHVEIYGTDYDTPDGTCIRDYIHILDLARAHILALEAPKSEFYNLGTGGGSSVREVIDCCRKVTGHKIPVVEKPRRPGDPPRLIAASEKIQEGARLAIRNSKASKRSSRAPGNGTRNFRTATAIEFSLRAIMIMLLTVELFAERRL